MVAPQLVTSRVLTTVSKLKPKSMLAMTELLAAGEIVAYDCGTRPPEESEPNDPAALEMASLTCGFSPPTRLVTAIVPLPLPSVRKVCTGTQVVQAAPPVRDERTLPFTTRTRICALVSPDVSEYVPPAPVLTLATRAPVPTL